MLSIGSPKHAAFKILIPCVKGKIFAIFCNTLGIASYGKVAPEKINIGKYIRLSYFFLSHLHQVARRLFLASLTNPGFELLSIRHMILRVALL